MAQFDCLRVLNGRWPFLAQFLLVDKAATPNLIGCDCWTFLTDPISDWLTLSDPMAQFLIGWPFLAQFLIGWPFLAQFLIGCPFLAQFLIG